MNKLFTKIAALCLGATMAVGVGVAVASSGKAAKPVSADTESGSVTAVNGAFSGWTSSGLGSKYADGSAKFDSNGDNIYKTNLFSGTVSSGMTSLVVTVEYKINGTGAAANGVTITPYCNGSYGSGTTQTGFSSTSKTTKSVTVSSGLANCTGFKLAYVKSSGNLGVYSVSWTATYTGTTKYTVTFNSGGGSITPDSQQVESGKTFTFPSPGTKTGYVFDGWSSNGGTTKYATGATSPAVTAAITYTGYWHEDPVATVTVSAGTFAKSYSTNGVWDWQHLTVTYTTEGGGGGTATGLTASNFTFSPSAPNSTSITSVSVTATYGGVTSSSITISGITVTEKQNLGGLVDGEKYFIIANGRYLGAFDSAPGAPAGTSKAWPGDESAPTSDDDAWLFTATATDDNWIITSKAGNTLYATATNNGLGCTSSGNDNWTVHSTANGLKITAKNGRYLTQYNQSNFRVYTSTTGQTEADSTVRFVKYVAPATIESVEFTGDMTKKAYYVGDSWDYSGLSIQATLSDATTEDLGTVASLIQSGDLEVEASPTSPALNVTSVSLLAYYGQDLLEASTTITGITVSTPRTLEDVTLDGDMETKTYTEGDSWSVTGLYLTLTYNVGLPDTIQLSTLTKDTDYVFDHDTAVAGDTEIEITGEYENFEFDKTVTGIVVNALPGVINFGTSSGYWQPALSGSTFLDNKGNTATITSDSTAWNTRGPTYQQIGSNASAASYVLVSIPLSQKAGIDAVSVTFSSSGSNSVDLKVYGDTVDDVIVNGSAPDSTNVTVSTGVEYTKINASTLHFKFEPTKGVKLTSISYTLGSQVQEFGTLASIEVSSTSMHSTIFEVDHTFSTEGLIITATDTVGFKKDFTTGFTTDYDGVTFDETAEDLEVTVTMTMGLVTKTTSYYIDVIEIPSYTLATSQSDLYEGMSVLIAYVENDSVFTAGALSGSYLSKVDGSKDGDDIRAGDGTYEFVVEYYGSDILLRHGVNYLKHTGDKSISLSSEFDTSCVWSYDGSALQNVSHDSYYLQYNKSSPRFTDYTGSQNDVGLYISSATPKTDLMGASTYAQKYLHMRDYLEGDGSCMDDSDNHYYSTAKTQYGYLTSGEKTEFAGLTDAVARLQAWARANGEVFDPNAKTFNAAHVTPLVNIVGEGNAVAIVVIVSVISLSAIGGYFFLRKRKEN